MSRSRADHVPRETGTDSGGGSRHRILVIEDDRDAAQLLAGILERAGYEVHRVDSVACAFNVIERFGLPHLAVVDIMLPGQDGFEFCRQVQQYSDLPVVLVSAIDEPDTVVWSIRQYAEDYVTKPYQPRELVARIGRVLKRIGMFAYPLAPIIAVDDHLSVDFTHQRVFASGRLVPITPAETKILYLLMRQAGQVVGTDFLLRRIWPFEEVFEDTLRVHIYRLRQKIDPRPDHGRYIVTERGVGYMFRASGSYEPPTASSSGAGVDAAQGAANHSTVA